MDATMIAFTFLLDDNASRCRTGTMIIKFRRGDIQQFRCYNTDQFASFPFLSELSENIGHFKETIKTNSKTGTRFDRLFLERMDDLIQLRANLAKIRELDQQLEQMEREEQARKYNRPHQPIDPEKVEFEILHEEMEQQKEISKSLLTENQRLQLKLETEKLRYEQTRNEIADFSQTQKESIEKQRRTMESEQNLQDLNSQKEEKRLKQSLDLLREKNEKLIEERDLLRKKLNSLKASLNPGGKKKKLSRKSK
jgi:hypothetical protein